ncbi:alpha/beta fold hydrolase [Nonomuraea sp. NPDC049784]|uniref:alpha/beta fold hydrolase n=1 Tax=Nonomuraea sp. NPDC049784 TaxID=3154361 RepID=UPI0033D873D7
MSSTARRRRRLLIASAVLFVVVGLLLVNAEVVTRQSAEASGNPTLPLDGGNIYVRQDGPPDAPALVLIHGLAASTHSWDALVPLLTKSHRVIRIDLLGHGQSAKPAGAGYGMPEQGRRVGEAMDRLGVKQAVVVGHSTGGAVATALAEQRPDLVTALAIIDTAPRLDAAISSGFVGGLLDDPVIGQLLWRLRTDSLIRNAASTAFSRRGYQVPQAVVDDARGMTYHAFIATSQDGDDYVNQRALPDRLIPLGKPLLVIFGEEDQRWRSSSAAEYRAVPGAKVELLPGVGHSPIMEDPPRTAALLLAFTASHTTQGH